jgi:hypothetical protein
MEKDFWEHFRRGPSPLQDDAVRARLQQAIIDGDPRAFRETLQGAYPDLAAQHRLYGVLLMTAQGMRPVMVDETGQQVGGPGFVIDVATPIDLLNVHFGPSEVTVTVGDQVWTPPHKPT